MSSSTEVAPVEAVEEKSAGFKISFGVKKRPQSNVVQASESVAALAVANREESDEERDEEEAKAAKRRKLTHLENGAANEDPEDVAKKAALVIAKPEELDWRVQRLLEQEKDGSITDDDRARLELLSASNPALAEIRKKENGGEEDGDAIFVDASKTNTEDADYGQVPIASFGLAILRGCGWKDGEGIGKNPQVVPLRLPERRPKGLGLGAAPKTVAPAAGGKAGSDKDAVSQDIKRGSFVRISQGRDAGAYGKVESRDDDNASLFVRLALGQRAIKVSLYSVYAVSAEEFNKDGKCINRDTYTEHKNRIDEKLAEEERKMREKDERKGTNERREKKKERDYVEFVEEDDEVWCRVDCIVRVISQKYKNGKHMDEKMRVVDVADRTNITLIDDRGRTHYNMKQAWLETVMPRSIGEKVMVVHGRLAGEKGVMVEKNKERQCIHARMLRGQMIEKLRFDDACLWRPEVVDLEDDEM